MYIHNVCVYTCALQVVANPHAVENFELHVVSVSHPHSPVYIAYYNVFVYVVVEERKPRPNARICKYRYSDTRERQSKDIQIKSQGRNLSVLLPLVGFEPTTFSVPG